ncbi:hypothetical protein AAG906_017686 [Vitis piasezkii]
MDNRDNLERLMTFTLLDYGHYSVDSLYRHIESTLELDYEGVSTPMGPNGPRSELIYLVGMEIDHHFVHEKVAVEALVTRFLLLSLQVVDVFNKALPKLSFQSFWLKLGVHKLPLPSLQGNVKESVDMGGMCK